MQWNKIQNIKLSKQELYDSIMNNLKFINQVLQNNHHTNSIEKMKLVYNELSDLMEAKDIKKK